MYSLVIVEDEKIARERLQHMIKWDELGFRVEATFADGQELLDYLKYNTVDVILTDIKMTHVSGLDIANYVAEHTLPIQVVLLSGYEEFEYAKRAIAYRVTDYLSKPVSIPKLKNTFQRIAEQLNKQNEQSLIRERQIQHYKQLINYEKQQFVTDVYYGAITSPKQIRKRLELLLGTNRQEKFFLLQLSLIRDSAYISVVENYGLDELQNQLLRIMETLYQEFEFYPVSWDTSETENGLSLLVFLWKKAEFPSNSNEEPLPQDIIATIESYLSVHVQVTSFQKIESLTELSHCYERVGKNMPSDTLVQNLDYLQLLREQNMLLASYLRENERKKGTALGHTLVHNLLRGGIGFTQRQCFYTITKLIDSITSRNISRQNSLYLQYATPDIYNIVQPEAIDQWLSDRLSCLFDFENAQSKGKANKTIDKITSYIQAHFTEDISLNSVAESVYLHPAYISRLIKERTGKTFSAFITDLRIEKALTLLENSNLHVYEIAERSGFNNLKYFYKVFREVTGKSPSDYRTTSKP